METFDVTPCGVIAAVAHVPGSKSLANRALVCAALAEGQSVLYGVPDGDDTEAMIEALVRLGVVVNRADEDNAVVVSHTMDRGSNAQVEIDARLAGTTSRFLTALAALREGPTVIDGGASLRARPIGDLLDALRTLGATLQCIERPGSLPVRVQRGALSGGAIAVSGGVSSQFTSALCMIGPYLEGGLSLSVTGDQVSESYVRMTLDTMASFGVTVTQDAKGIVIPAGRYAGSVFTIPPDASSATYPAAAVAIRGGTVRLVGLAASASQPDSRFPLLLARMGCSVETDGDDVVVSRDPATPLVGITVDMRDMSDAVPTLAAVAACATTRTVISGVGFIRGKESDRLGDLALELGVLGASVEVLADGVAIEPAALHGGRVETHHDHRLAMSLALIGLVVEGVSIGDPDVVRKSWPTFWASMAQWTS